MDPFFINYKDIFISYLLTIPSKDLSYINRIVKNETEG